MKTAIHFAGTAAGDQVVLILDSREHDLLWADLETCDFGQVGDDWVAILPRTVLTALRRYLIAAVNTRPVSDARHAAALVEVRDTVGHAVEWLDRAARADITGEYPLSLARVHAARQAFAEAGQ